MNKLDDKKIRRMRRVRARISGTINRPRLAVFRSLKSISAQIIDDQTQVTLAWANEKELTKEETKKNKTERAKLVGEKLAQKALEKKIEQIVFDRRGYKYHGRVKSLADGARSKGLKF